MTISPKFPIGSTVYFRVSPETSGMVTGLLVRPANVIIYVVTFGDELQERYCYEIELTDEKSFVAE
jgi:hypothetical protein